MFGLASGSGFGAAGRSKGLWTFTLSQGAKLVNPPDDGAKLVNSPNDGANLVNSLDIGAKPVNSIEYGAKLVNPMDIGAKSVNSMDIGSKPVNSMDIGAKPVNSIDYGAKPVNSIDDGVKPVNSSDHGAMLVSSMDYGAKLVNSPAEPWTGMETVDLKVPTPQLTALPPLELDSSDNLLMEALPAADGNFLVDLPASQLTGHLDDGYDSALSPGSNLSSNTEDYPNDVASFTRVNNENILNINLIYDNPDDLYNNLNILEDTTGINQQIVNNNCFIADSQNDRAWYPEHELTLQKIGVITNLQDAVIETGLKETKKKVKHRRGQTRMLPYEMLGEDHKKNVERCRKYREEKKERDGEQLTELEQLERKNNQLVQEEEEMRTRLERAKKAYIDLIVVGRIKFT